MDRKTLVSLKVLLNRYHPEGLDSVLKFFSEEEAKEISNEKVQSDNIELFFMQPESILQNIHYSWLVPIFNKWNPDLQLLILSSLPDSHKDKLRNLLKPKKLLPIPTPTAKKYFLQILMEAFLPKELLPIEYLPEKNIKPLAKLSKNEFLDLFDLLGMYDLAEEVRHIVDKNKLKNIYRCLNLKKRKYLRFCLHQPEKLQMSDPMKLERWDGSSEKLLKMIHKRGIVRFAFALSGKETDFLWHITRILDKGRGEILERYYSKTPLTEVTSILEQQVIISNNFLQHQGEDSD